MPQNVAFLTLPSIDKACVCTYIKLCGRDAQKRIEMTRMGGFLSAVLCGATVCAPAVANNCDDALYRRYHPAECAKESGFTFATGATITGGLAAVIGGTLAAIGMNSDSGSSNDDNHATTTPNYAQHTLPAYTHVGDDVTSVQLAEIVGNNTYAKNINQYNDIRLAYSLARGYTGAGSNIAIIDSSDAIRHGAYVADLAGGSIAPNANVVRYSITNDDGVFQSFDTIANVIGAASDANIYNFSWAEKSVWANNLGSRRHYEDITSRDFVQSLVNAAQTQDAIMVWAAGNEGRTQSSALAGAPLVIPELNGHFVNVVAWDSNTGALADFSNQCGATKDFCITAPGAGLKTEVSKHSQDGTSFAAPIVSAAIAVIREAFPYMNANEVTSLLFETARDLGAVGVDDVYGHGMLDMERATRPVGVNLVPLDDGATVAMRTAHANGTIAHKIKDENITFAFVDKYGRPFETKMNDNISIKNHSVGFDRLREHNVNVAQFGNVEFGFKQSEILRADGFLDTDEQNMMTFVGTKYDMMIGDIKLFHGARIGFIKPKAADNSMINAFSNIFTGTMTLGAQYQDLTLSIAVPDTIISGHMNMRTPTGRSANGQYTFANHDIDLVGRPAVEYSATYKFMTAAFVDNPFGQDEFYFIAKTKLQF